MPFTNYNYHRIQANSGTYSHILIGYRKSNLYNVVEKNWTRLTSTSLNFSLRYWSLTSPCFRKSYFCICRSCGQPRYFFGKVYHASWLGIFPIYIRDGKSRELQSSSTKAIFQYFPSWNLLRSIITETNWRNNIQNWKCLNSDRGY